MLPFMLGAICTDFGRLKFNAHLKSLKYGKEIVMKKYVCDVCGWEYDEEKGDPEHSIAPGTSFDDLPDDFECPLCGVGKDSFSEA